MESVGSVVDVVVGISVLTVVPPSDVSLLDVPVV